MGVVHQGLGGRVLLRPILTKANDLFRPVLLRPGST